MPERLHRDKDQTVLGGVSIRLASYFGVRPAWVRLTWVLLALCDRMAPAAYFLLWILLPRGRETCHSRAERLRNLLDDLRLQNRALHTELGTILERVAVTSGESPRRLVLLGGLLAVMGLLFLADSLHLLGPLRLNHLRPLALVLIGALALNRAVHDAQPMKEEAQQR